MDSIIQKLKKRDLSDSTINTYTSILRSLYNKTREDNDKLDVDYFRNHQKIIPYLDNKMCLASAKTVLSALVVLFDDDTELKKIYHKPMLNKISHYHSYLSEQKKSKNQEENWITQDELKLKLDELRTKSYHLMKFKKLDNEQKIRLRDFIILCLYTMIEPRRLQDYIFMKFRNYSDEEKDNYIDIDNNKLVFNKYKTSRIYGKQTIDIPKKMSVILKKYIKLISDNKLDYLLFDSNFEKLTAPKLNYIINKIFGKSVSVNNIRHSYISEVVLKNMPKLTKLEEISKNMGHSVNTQILYKKI